jgi:hypothetical protein
MSTSTMWIVLGATSALCFAMKLLGHLVPEAWLANERLQRINALIPICLLSALFAKAPFPVVVVAAAGTSALVYHLHLG